MKISLLPSASFHDKMILYYVIENVKNLYEIHYELMAEHPSYKNSLPKKNTFLGV